MKGYSRGDGGTSTSGGPGADPASEAVRHGASMARSRVVARWGSRSLALTVVAAIVAGAEHFGMSASTAAVIESAIPATWTRLGRAESGYAITYTFAAGGVSYRDTANRTWEDVFAAEAKVCFDPGDPGGVHRLVPGSYTCAGLNPFEDFGQW